MGPPRSTAASKAAAGPSNETSDATPTVTPQDELAIANAEIERLKEQLATQNTPNLGTLSPNKLAEILDALAQRLTRTDPPAALAALAKSAKIPDPPLLTDGKDPTFDS